MSWTDIVLRIVVAILIGTVIGAFIISVLTNGLRSMAVSTEWQTVVTGLVLAGAVYFDLLRKRGKAA